MDPFIMTAMSGAAVSLLKQYLLKAGEGAGKAVAEGAWSKVKDLLNLVRSKFGERPGAEVALNRLIATPSAAGHETAVQAHLDHLLQHDLAFADTVATLLKTSLDEVATVVHNYVNVDSVTHIGRAETVVMHIGRHRRTQREA